MASATEETLPSSGVAAPLVVDLGKKRRKAVKQLLNGEGKLLSVVNDAISELKAAGTISDGAQPVIVVVRPRRRKRNWLFPLS
jgi:hypothetical protein